MRSGYCLTMVGITMWLFHRAIEKCQFTDDFNRSNCCFNGDFPSQTSQKFQRADVVAGTVLPLPKGKWGWVKTNSTPFLFTSK